MNRFLIFHSCFCQVGHVASNIITFVVNFSHFLEKWASFIFYKIIQFSVQVCFPVLRHIFCLFTVPLKYDVCNMQMCVYTVYTVCVHCVHCVCTLCTLCTPSDNYPPALPKSFAVSCLAWSPSSVASDRS